ncbi:adenosylhomocysteine nucleosidase [Bifidobacterium bohemicum]|uniref:adenosylhomocysteine nucleosidase n=1 Tax=Bifidobacterium bohemicum DSM 22767 TaxID=1437606 RepID=A0A086ZE73_9BIFI|nr:5'-methylthioadenosine/S-adenosylhomocysteine nucleosidase [Bifidobacterium bohemicum]KFI44823.1 5'-methylthioadenosine nucleosidase [Bifidobacterium bohemicum DSM 22767]SCB94796.1 adenosylhomocysteine nucleosidase [Bifidobacterium bohemicum]
MKTIAIIGAMDEEVALIGKSLDGVQHSHVASLDINVGTVEAQSGESVTVAATVGGMGLVNAAATTQCLVDLYHPDAIVFSGIAGSLNKSMHINDIVLGGTLRYLDSDMRMIAQWKPQTEEFHSDKHLIEVASSVLDDMGMHHITGVIASGNNFIGTPEAAAKVAQQTHADAVEMEGAAVAHVAARNDVPALVIRALSDEADTDYEVFKEFDVSEYADTAARLAISIVARL